MSRCVVYRFLTKIADFGCSEKIPKQTPTVPASCPSPGLSFAEPTPEEGGCTFRCGKGQLHDEMREGRHWHLTFGQGCLGCWLQRSTHLSTVTARSEIAPASFGSHALLHLRPKLVPR